MRASVSGGRPPSSSHCELDGEQVLVEEAAAALLDLDELGRQGEIHQRVASG